MVLHKEPTQILFAAYDDNSSLRAKRILDALGYHVTVRTSSAGTLSAFREQPENWDLVIIDHVVSNMTGFELEEEIHRVRPELVTLVLPPSGAPATARRDYFTALEERRTGGVQTR